MLLRPLQAWRVTLLLAPLLGSCTLLGAPPDLPAPIPSVTIAPGDVLRLHPPAGSDEPAALLTVAPDGTVVVPGVGTVVVEGYTVEDVAAVLTSLYPDLGAVRIEALPAVAQSRVREAATGANEAAVPR